MKKLITIILAALIISQTSLGETTYPLTVKERNMSVILERKPGTRIVLRAKSPEVTGWTVESGGITIQENQFIMPQNAVTINTNYIDGYMLVSI